MCVVCSLDIVCHSFLRCRCPDVCNNSLCCAAVQVLLRALQPTHEASTNRLLPELWRIVAEYASQTGASQNLLLPVIRFNFLVTLCDSADLTTVANLRYAFPSGIACTPSGVVLVMCSTRTMYAVHPTSGRCDPFAQIPHNKPPTQLKSNDRPRYALEVVASEFCAFVSDPLDHCLHRVTLPAEWCAVK
jgi:hypothetical protein